MKLSPCLAIGALLVQSLFVAAQEPAKPETKVVLRVSRELIQKLAGARFTKDQPIASNANGANVTGSAHVEGDIDVRLRESETESDFDLILTGNVSTQLTAVRRPVIVCAHGDAPFNATRRVVLLNGKFTAEPVCISVANQFALDGIDSFRGGIGGALTRRVARPFVRRGLADGNLQADDEIRSEFTSALEEPTDRIVTALNCLEPTVADVRQKLEILADKKKLVLVPYHKGTKNYLYLSVGVPGRVITKLPSLERKDRAPLELWIAKRHDLLGELALEFGLELLAAKWEKDAEKIGKRIIERHPELVPILGNEIKMEAHILTKDDWHVITLTPTIKGRAVIELP